MKVEVIVPDEYLGDVMGDLNSRRGKIEGMTQRNQAQVVTAFVPLSSMFGYVTDSVDQLHKEGQFFIWNLRNIKRCHLV